MKFYTLNTISAVERVPCSFVTYAFENVQYAQYKLCKVSNMLKQWLSALVPECCTCRGPIVNVLYQWHTYMLAHELHGVL